MNHSILFRTPLYRWLTVLVTFALVVFAYWPGLAGPLLLDDFGNLADVTAWLEKQRSATSVIFGNRSGPGGRPVAMASFLLDAALWGPSVWHFKLTNLAIHCLSGLVVLALYRRLVARDRQLADLGQWLPLLLAVAWMSLPINVSSVLYVVQRMAILSTLFMLLAILAYVVGRSAMEAGDRRGSWWLIATPFLTAPAFFSKEIGLLVPPLLLAIEYAWFSPARGRTRPKTIRWFWGLSIALAASALAAGALLYPGYVVTAYENRDFTIAERLLTQPRILWDYVAAIFFPYGPRLGLFHDNYAKSVGLLAPWTTLLAIVAWISILAAAWKIRRSAPSALGGLLFFLAGHAMESTIFPLELYFEHRNYLPSIGLLLAATAVIVGFYRKLPEVSPLFRRCLPYFVLLVPLTYLMATHGRARVWSSNETLFAQELRHNPTSPRMRSFLAGFAISDGKLAEALAHIDAAERASPQPEAATHSLWRAVAYCGTGNTIPPELYDELDSRAHGKIPTYAMTAWEMLSNRVENGECANADTARLTAIGARWVNTAPMPQSSQQVWRTRYYLARLLASSGRLDAAAAEADRAWGDSQYNNGIGVFLFQVNASLGNTAKCRSIFQQLKLAHGGDYQLNSAIDIFGKALKEDSIEPIGGHTPRTGNELQSAQP